MIDRSDPVLAQLPQDDDLPMSFLRLPRNEQAWRGRLMAMLWLLYRDEAYAWSLALAPDPESEREAAVRAASDRLILALLAVAPLVAQERN